MRCVAISGGPGYPDSMQPLPLRAISAELVLEHLERPILLLDEGERVLWSNQAARQIFGAAEGRPLKSLDPSATSTALPEGGLRVARFPPDAVERVAALTRAAAEASVLRHDLKNLQSSVSLAVRAVGRALGEDETAVLAELVARLEAVEQRIRRALASTQI
jgi:nitrogen-specific signal transduction histidine kinase